MKKLFAILAIICLLAGTAAAESLDYTAMTNEELHQVINLARNELTRRELTAGSRILLFEQDGVSLYLTGEYEIQELGAGKHVLELEGIVINDSDQMIDVRIDTVTVNGWEVNGGSIQQVGAGKKKKDTFEIRLFDGDIHSYEEIEAIEFNFRVTSSADYKKLFTIENATVYFNQGQAADAKAAGDAIAALQNAVDGISGDVTVTYELHQGNILNESGLTEGRLGSNGNTRIDGTYADYYTTPYERVAEGQTYSAWEEYQGAMQLPVVAVYDSEKTFIQNVTAASGTNNTFVIPEEVGAYYARFSLSKAIADNSARKPRIVTGAENKAWTAYRNEEEEIRVSADYVLKAAYEQKIAELTVCHAYLPDVIYCAVGRTIDIYNKQVCVNAERFHFRWICSKGFAEGRRFTITADAVEDLSLTLKIYNDMNQEVYAKTATLKCVSPLTEGTVNVLPIGDSMTYGGGQWLAEVETTLSSGAIHFVGTVGVEHRSVTYYTEGYNGFAASTFLNTAERGGVTNPFYNTSSNQFDYSYYLANANISTPDAVIIELGTNDMNGTDPDQAGGVADNIVSMITRIKAASPATPVFVCNAIYRSNQDGIAHQMNTQGYTASSGKYKYNEDLKIFSLMTSLADKLEDTSGVYFIPLALCHDSENNFGKQTIKLNSRSQVDITIPADSVHPNKKGQDASTEGIDVIGYLQFADVIFSVLSGVLGANGAGE